MKDAFWAGLFEGFFFFLQPPCLLSFFFNNPPWQNLIGRNPTVKILSSLSKIEELTQIHYWASKKSNTIRPLHVSLEGFSFSTQVHYNSCCKTSSEIALTSITLKLWTQTKLNVKPKINLKNWKPHKNRCLFVWFGFFIFQTTRFGSRTRKWNQTKSYCKSP